jgi:hypothetical protein
MHPQAVSLLKVAGIGASVGLVFGCLWRYGYHYPLRAESTQRLLDAYSTRPHRTYAADVDPSSAISESFREQVKEAHAQQQ